MGERQDGTYKEKKEKERKIGRGFKGETDREIFKREREREREEVRVIETDTEEGEMEMVRLVE